jgi:hypothetical protein
MRAHLESGCKRCAETVGWLEELTPLAAFDASLDVPEELLSRALALYRPRESEDWIERLQQIAAELVSATTPEQQPAGVRSITFESERMLYRAGDYLVDLKLDRPDAGASAEIVGQVTNEIDRQTQLDGVVIQVVAAGRTLGQTETNQFGEFIIARPDRPSVILRLAMKREGIRIDLSLKAKRPTVDPT